MKRSKFASIIVPLVMAANGAFCAPNAITLNRFPLAGYTDVDTVKTTNITGTCAGSIVRVMGITGTTGDFFDVDSDAGKIIIRDGPRHELVINGMSDHNGVACITNSTGNFLLVWHVCGGSGCGDDFAFTIIDPKRLLILAPTDARQFCDTDCATKITGSGLPRELNTR